jgi:hypothetical protein
MKKKKSAKKSNMSIYLAREPCEESPTLEPCEEPSAEPQPPDKFKGEEALQKDVTRGSSTAPKESPKQLWTS